MTKRQLRKIFLEWLNEETHSIYVLEALAEYLGEARR